MFLSNQMTLSCRDFQYTIYGESFRGRAVFWTCLVNCGIDEECEDHPEPALTKSIKQKAGWAQADYFETSVTKPTTMFNTASHWLRTPLTLRKVVKICSLTNCISVFKKMISQTWINGSFFSQLLTSLSYPPSREVACEPFQDQELNTCDMIKVAEWNAYF